MLNPRFLARMKEYLGSEYEAFIDSYNLENIRGLRVNSNYLNSEKFASLCNFSVCKLDNIEGGFKVLDEIKFGFHPLHHAGAIYLQDPSAMLPALACNIKADYKVLDLCASPGGKSSQLATYLSEGVLYANEIDNKRCWTLYSNIERLGFKNVVVTNNDSKDFLKNFQNYFDLILVDAPCSGEGMFRKYPDSQALWSEENIAVCYKRDKEILDNADKLLKQGGRLIYSTCTFAKEENEDIIEYLMTKGYQTIPINKNLLPYLSNGFISNTYRIYPHHHFGEGQFLAVMEKHSDNFGNTKLVKKQNIPLEFKKFCDDYLKKAITNIFIKGDDIYYLADNADTINLKVLNYGCKLGKIQNKRFIPDHHFFKAFADLFKNQVDLALDDERINKYLHGEQIEAEVDNGYGVLLVAGIPLGGFKASNNYLNNYYPKGLRNFN